MKVKDVMHKGVTWVAPTTAISKVARKMRTEDIGAVPVGENDRLVGMITDRDIAIRVVAADKQPTGTKVREAMTPGIEWCFEDEDTREVAAKMARQKVRRMPVISHDKRLVGIVSLGDLATEDDPAVSARALHGIAQPGGRHSQSAAPEAAGRH